MKFLFLAIWLLGATAIADIHSVDWENCTYPWTEGLMIPNSPVRTFTLTDGTIPIERRADGSLSNMPVTLKAVIYGDLTGDGDDEAVLTMDITTGGSAAPQLVYIYSLHDGKRDPLWYFNTGDRADGGLRGIRVKNGKLVVDLNSPEGSNGDCCATQFVRTTYHWSPGGFVAENQETLKVPD